MKQQTTVSSASYSLLLHSTVRQILGFLRDTQEDLRVRKKAWTEVVLNIISDFNVVCLIDSDLDHGFHYLPQETFSMWAAEGSWGQPVAAPAPLTQGLFQELLSIGTQGVRLGSPVVRISFFLYSVHPPLLHVCLFCCGFFLLFV